MTNVEYMQMLCKHAEQSPPAEPGKVFAEITRGEGGVKGLKRDQFNEFYARLCSSSFFRSAELGAAMSKDLIGRLQQKALNAKCTPEQALKLAPMFAKLEQGGRLTGAAFEAFKPFLSDSAEELDRLSAEVAQLWQLMEDV